MPEQIRFGIIGCGNSGKMIAREVQNMSELEIVAICDTDRERAVALAQQYEIPKGVVYSSLFDFLSREDMEYVVVGVPSGLHAEVGIEVAKMMHNVVVEKPIEVNLKAADSLIDACKRAGVQLHVISQNRFKPDMQKAKGLVEKLGPLIGAEATMNWYRTQRYYSDVAWRGTWAIDGGGALMNQCIHMVDALRYLAGNPRYVRGIAGLLGHEKIQTEDLLYAIGKLQNGALFSIKATTCDRGIGKDGKEEDTNQLRIYGSNGILVLDKYVLGPESAIEDDSGKIIPVESAVKETIESGSGPLSQSGHGDQLIRIGRAIRGEEIEMVTGEDARDTLAFIMAIYRSIEEGGKKIFYPSRRDYVPDPTTMRRRLAR